MIVLSGMRPTGRLHLGNYEGALKSWIRLQDLADKCYYFVADIHALTTGYSDTSKLSEYVQELILDWIAAGLDPDKSTIFVQSQIKEHTELHLLFSMITPTPWLLRNPTIKEQAKDLEKGETEDLKTIEYGLLGYPVLQAADILIYKADTIPVGEDQVAHIELTRQIARRFNNLYGEVFPEPESYLTDCCKLPGIDGRRMSKSLGNTILFSEEPNQTTQKIFSMYTDPKKIRKNDPGHPEDGCVVFAYHTIYNTDDEVIEIAKDCIAGKLGCVDCKKKLSDLLIDKLAPIRERRYELEQKTDSIKEILYVGSREARKIASRTMEEVHEAMKLWK